MAALDHHGPIVAAADQERRVWPAVHRAAGLPGFRTRLPGLATRPFQLAQYELEASGGINGVPSGSETISGSVAWIRLLKKNQPALRGTRFGRSCRR
jgi:hypothetical protein